MKTILYIDDDRELTRLGQQIMAEQGCRALVAHDIREATVIVETGVHPDLVLIDFQMAPRSGEETLELLREKFPFLRDTKTVGFTGLTCDDPMLDNFRSHVSEIVSKPVDLDDFITLIERLTA